MLFYIRATKERRKKRRKGKGKKKREKGRKERKKERVLTFIVVKSSLST